MGGARVYLDWAATAPPEPRALDAARDALARGWGNPASVHAEGRAARAVVEAARAELARLAEVDPRDVVFTGGGTEANNLALASAARARPGALVTTPLAHPSVAKVFQAQTRGGAVRDVRFVGVRPDGALDLAALDAALAGEVSAVALPVVAHETGVVLDVAAVAARVRAAAPGAWLHLDAVQAWGKVPCALRDADSMAFAAHKIGGPKGVGALLHRPGAPLAAVLEGGAQERGLRPGTVDAAALAGLAAAARLARLEGPARAARALAARARFEQGLAAAAPGAEVLGAAAPRAPHVTGLLVPGWSGHDLVVALDLEGVACAAGSACSAGTVEVPPGVAAQVGAARAGAFVRFSFGHATTDDDVDAALDALARVTARVSGASPRPGAAAPRP